MVDSKLTPRPTPSVYVYRVDRVGDVFHVLRCEADPVARFDNEEHAAFLVELLKGAAHG